MSEKPSIVSVINMEIKDINDMDHESWTWEVLEKGGFLKVRHDDRNTIKVYVE